ncbi:MAG: hypothetical protein JKY48_13925, partial [Flavobacteriales bacterium]|nr:hypothetical protein [Flavobacteriales bacterium]
MKKLNLLFTMMLALCLTGFSQFRLETVPPLTGGNGSGGTAFQIIVKSPIILDSLRQAFQAGAQIPEIWYTATDTTGPPNITTANGWTLLATSPSLTGLSAGLTPTLQTIPVGLGLVLSPGIYRFYIGAATGANVVYTTWNAANQDVFDDTFITIRNGSNIGYGGAVPNPNFSPRQWNGGVIYSPLGGANDASVLSVDSPIVFCAGSYPVVATIGNYGINQINSVDINWEVNGVVQPVVNYTTLLDTLFGLSANTAQVNLGTVPFIAGNNTVKVYTSNPNGVADTTNLNDTMFVDVRSALEPSDILVSNATLSSIDVTVVGAAGTIDYEYGPTGFILGSGTSGNSASATFTISGLTQGTTFDVYVRSNCGANDTSRYVGPQTFNTSFGLPFAQDFENFANGILNNPFPEGWSASQAAGFPIPRWESELGQGFSPGFQTGPIWDHTNYGGPGIFMFMNSSGGANDSVDLFSPPIYVDATVNQIEIGYWYFNFGAGVQRIEIIADTNGVETILATHTGAIQATQQDPWLFNSVRMTGVQGQSVTLKFRGYNSTGFNRGDLAIDDITVDPILPLNAGVLEIQSPSGALCPGLVSPVVGVKNFGSNTITTVDVITDVNGLLDTVTFTGTILPGDTASVSLSSFTLSASIIYDIDFYTNLPNGAADQFPSDDTLSIDALRTGLSGVYTLDASLPASATNFTSFSELEGSVNNFGMCGPATVNVAAGTYNDVLYFDNPTGLSALSSLTIDGGDSSMVTLTNDLSADDAVIRFNGASFITIKNMTVSTSRVGGGNHAVIHFGGESNNDSIVAVRILVDPTATFGAYGILASSLPTNTFTGGNHANRTVVMNSSIDGGDNSVRFIGNGG